MGVATKTIETTGIIESKYQLILDKPLPVVSPNRVHIIILWPGEVDIDEREWLQTASVNPAFDFLKEQEEDIYTFTDGRPFNDQR